MIWDQKKIPRFLSWDFQVRREPTNYFCVALVAVFLTRIDVFKL